MPAIARAMPNTYTSLHYHILFSTKHREPWIAKGWRDRLWEYLGGTIRGLEGVPLKIGGVEDHIHALIGLKTTHRISDFSRELKKATSIWAAENHDRDFAWQEGYAIFSVSVSVMEAVGRYIERQEEHHRKISFEES